MDTTDETISFPKSVMGFYIDLYCKRKSVKVYPGERLSSKVKKLRMITDAKKSWYTLSPSERQQLYIKYRDYKAKLKEKISNSLKDAEPFMRVKDSNRKNSADSNRTTSDDNEQPDETNVVVPEVTLQMDKTAEFPLQGNQTESCNITLVNDSHREKVIQPQECDRDSMSGASVQTKVITPIIPEPTPPNVRTGKELFDMIKSSTEFDCWSSVPRLAKQRYNSAVMKLKKDYIQKYKRYLESLSSEELFKYYNKNSF